MKREHSLKNGIMKGMVIVTMLSVLLLGALWIYSTVQDFQREMKRYQTERLVSMEREIKESTLYMRNYIQYQRALSEERLKESLRERTYEAHQIITSIYEANKDSLSQGQIRVMMVEALRDVRFNDGRGYYFMDAFDGEVILYPVAPKSEGTNAWNLQDEEGNPILQEEIELARTQGEGFVDAYWMKPGAEEDKSYRKISFIKAFEPYGWYIGCGEYLDEMERTIQVELIAYLNNTLYGEARENFFFLHDYKGIELANGIDPGSVGTDYWDYQDVEGTYVVRKQVELARSGPDGGSYFHYWNGNEGGAPVEKMTYVAAIPEWEWVIGTVRDTRFIHKTIASYEDQLAMSLAQKMLTIAGIVGLLLLLSMFLTFLVVRKMQKQMNAFHQYAEQASSELKLIDEKTIRYQELKEVATSINSMSERINRLIRQDDLTGALARGYGFDLFARELQEAYQADEGYALLMIDIDWFKKVNDTFGHSVGDEMLVRLVKAIQENLSEDQPLVRLGGEEFLVGVRIREESEAMALAERLRKSAQEILLPEGEKALSVSIGVALGKGEDLDTLAARADEALYQAKRKGRNRVEISEE